MAIYLFTYDALIDNDGSLSTDIKKYLTSLYEENNTIGVLRSVYLIDCTDTHKVIFDKLQSRYSKKLSYIITEFSNCYQDNELDDDAKEWLKNHIQIRYEEVPTL